MQKIPKVSFHDLVAADKAVIDYLTSSLNNVGFFVINKLINYKKANII